MTDIYEAMIDPDYIRPCTLRAPPRVPYASPLPSRMNLKPRLPRKPVQIMPPSPHRQGRRGYAWKDAFCMCGGRRIRNDPINASEEPCEDSGKWPQATACQPAMSLAERFAECLDASTCKRVGVVTGVVLAVACWSLQSGIALFSKEAGWAMVVVLPMIPAMVAACVAGQSRKSDLWDLFDAALLPMLAAHCLKFFVDSPGPDWIRSLPMSLATGAVGVLLGRMVMQRDPAPGLHSCNEHVTCN